MNPQPQQPLEERVLIVAPTGRDAELSASFLVSAGIQAEICNNLTEVSDKIRQGCGAVLLAEESLERNGLNYLADMMDQQPPWSDLPVVIVAGKGKAVTVRAHVMASFSSALNLTFLERPLHPVVLTSTLQVALRGRRRQYQTRDLFCQREQDLENIRQQEQALKLRNERLHLLSETLAQMLSAAQPEQLVRQLFCKISVHLQVDCYLHFVVTEAGGYLRLASHTGIPDEKARQIQPVRFGDSVLGATICTTRPLVRTAIEGSQQDDIGFLRELGLCSYVCHPLIVGERLLGCLGFGSHARDSFSEEDLQLMRTMAQYVAVALDRARAERSLREGETRLRTALDAGKLGAWEWEIAKNRVTCSARVYEFFGLKPAEFGGTIEALYDRIHRDDVQRIRDEFVSALASDGVIEVEFRAMRPSGESRWLSANARAVYDDSGKPVRMLGGVIDLTDRKNTELALKEAQFLLAREAEHLERLVQERTASLKDTAEQLETFCYTVAHDLRAPLRAQQGFAYALLEGYGLLLDDEAKHYLKRIIASAEKLNQLVTDLLTYARVSREELEFHKVDLGKVIDEALAVHEAEIQERKAKTSRPKQMPLVLGHEATLRMAVANLVSNALKFSKDKPQIRFSVEERENMVRLWVEDNGIGIDPEYHAQIFGIFNRLHKEEYPGTGIGLALVRKTINRMKGQVGLESQEGKGSRFWIELPRVVPAAKTEPILNSGSKH